MRSPKIEVFPKFVLNLCEGQILVLNLYNIDTYYVKGKDLDAVGRLRRIVMKEDTALFNNNLQ